MNANEIVRELRNEADKWEKQHSVIGCGQLRVQDALRDAAAMIEQQQADLAELREAANSIPLPRLREICAAEWDGRCVVLPCKVGDTVWAYDDVFNQIAPHQVDMVELYGRKGMSFCSNWRKNGELMADLDFDVDDIGKTVFLTHKEAEAALRKLDGGGQE